MDFFRVNGTALYNQIIYSLTSKDTFVMQLNTWTYTCTAVNVRFKRGVSVQKAIIALMDFSSALRSALYYQMCEVKLPKINLESNWRIGTQIHESKARSQYKKPYMVQTWL